MCEANSPQNMSTSDATVDLTIWQACTLFKVFSFVHLSTMLMAFFASVSFSGGMLRVTRLHQADALKAVQWTANQHKNA